MLEKTLIHPRAWLPVAAALVLLAPAVTAQRTTSELLEEAVYQEETVGDLDAAMEIYQQIADDAEARRPLAARALYRLYRCHQRQGEEILATLVLGRLRKEYPDYEELLAGEAEGLPRSIVLEPVPWPDDEIQVLVVRLATGAEIGPLITSAHPVVVDGDAIWRLGLRRFYGVSPENQSSTVMEMRREDFTPVRSRLNNSQIGRFDLDFLPGEVVVRSYGRSGGSRDRSVKVGQQVYDTEMRFHLLRRLPLRVGYQAVLPSITSLGEVFDLPLEVTSREEVEVPAGTFECFRLEMPLLSQTFFIATGPRRELVKIEAPGLTVGLVETLERRADEPVVYRDPDVDFSVTLPAGWHVYPPCPASKVPVSVQLIDPEAEVQLACVEAATLPDGEPTPRSLAQGSIDYNRRGIAGLEVDEESWNQRQVAGHPAISWVSTHDAGKDRIARHETVVAGESRYLKLTFITTRERLDDLRETFDEIAGDLAVR